MAIESDEKRTFIGPEGKFYRLNSLLQIKVIDNFFDNVKEHVYFFDVYFFDNKKKIENIGSSTCSLKVWKKL